MEIPRDPTLDSTFALLREGYPFIQNRRRKLASDIFETRLLLQPTICLGGEEAARLFYRTDLFHREGAAPGRLRKTLFGEGGVQGLDGEEHRARKALFMDLMTPDSLGRLNGLMEMEWRGCLNEWSRKERVVFLDETARLLCRVICAWSGVPLDEARVPARTRDLLALVEGAGAVGPRHWRGRIARKKTERWVASLVAEVRAGELAPPPGSTLRNMATWRSAGGRLLPPRIAAVEILNVLRPTVAVAYYLTWVALALHQNPEERRRLEESDGLTRDQRILDFAQEVRRFYPFFPFAAARVRESFEWEGYHFPADRRVLLDLYGTNRDPGLWDDPEDFRPSRFRQWEGGLYDLVPQGGGTHLQNHRCAGEFITLEIMWGAVDVLTRVLDYDVPAQDLEVDPSHMPGRPKSGFIVTNVRPRAV